MSKRASCGLRNTCGSSDRWLGTAVAEGDWYRGHAVRSAMESRGESNLKAKKAVEAHAASIAIPFKSQEML